MRARRPRGRCGLSTPVTRATRSGWRRSPTRLRSCFPRSGGSATASAGTWSAPAIPEQGFLRRAREFASVVALRGAGVVSGAAAGVDRACHLGALDAGGEILALSRACARRHRRRPGASGAGHPRCRRRAVSSELPPGVRASRQDLPPPQPADLRIGRRGGGAAAPGSTAGRCTPRACPEARPAHPRLAGEVWAEAALGCNLLLRHGIAPGPSLGRRRPAGRGTALRCGACAPGRGAAPVRAGADGAYGLLCAPRGRWKSSRSSPGSTRGH